MDRCTPERRAKIAVITPEGNTVVEQDYSVLALPDVTFFYNRIEASPRAPLHEPALSDDSNDVAIRIQREGVARAVEQAMKSQPDHLVLAVSQAAFWGGAIGSRSWEREIAQLSEVGLTTGASACRRALEWFGAKRIAFISPHTTESDRHTLRFFTEYGFDVVDHYGFRCANHAAAAKVTDAQLRPILDRFLMAGIDAIVQTGTNLRMMRLGAAVELHTGVPVIPVNAACVWDAYRTCGIKDRLIGFNRLLEEN